MQHQEQNEVLAIGRSLVVDGTLGSMGACLPPKEPDITVSDYLKNKTLYCPIHDISYSMPRTLKFF